jgi:hypothetical protein
VENGFKGDTIIKEKVKVEVKDEKTTDENPNLGQGRNPPSNSTGPKEKRKYCNKSKKKSEKRKERLLKLVAFLPVG